MRRDEIVTRKSDSFIEKYSLDETSSVSESRDDFEFGPVLDEPKRKSYSVDLGVLVAP